MQNLKYLFWVVIFFVVSSFLIIIKGKNVEIQEQKERNHLLSTQVELQNSKIEQWLKESAELKERLAKINSQAAQQSKKAQENIKNILEKPIPKDCQDVIKYLAIQAQEISKN